MSEGLPEIATAVVQWQMAHGRNHLPWQGTRDPYRVWLSEIMLQQTQVVTVLDYYPRFLARFPTVQALAAAPQEDVLALWSGLGYYSRARNLHRCAQQVCELHAGAFPRSVEELSALPGIGRSTAGAIASFCFAVRAPILDANVRRVLTRVLGFDADLAVARNEKVLWGLADQLLPNQDLDQAMPRYTQGLMDLGAGLCTPKSPSCLLCPLQSVCKAHRQQNPESFPVRTRKLKRSAQAWWLLVARDAQQRVWLERRPQSGIWAGLFCVPVLESRVQVESRLAAIDRPVAEDLPTFLHVLTHKDLHLHPVQATVSDPAAFAAEADGGWYDRAQWDAMGLPAPIRKLLDGLDDAGA